MRLPPPGQGTRHWAGSGGMVVLVVLIHGGRHRGWTVQGAPSSSAPAPAPAVHCISRQVVGAGRLLLLLHGRLLLLLLLHGRR